MLVTKHETDLAILELDELKVTLDHLARILHEKIHARVLELRHGQVVGLHLDSCERLEDPVHTRLEHALETAVLPDERTLVLG